MIKYGVGSRCPQCTTSKNAGKMVEVARKAKGSGEEEVVMECQSCGFRKVVIEMAGQSGTPDTGSMSS